MNNDIARVSSSIAPHVSAFISERVGQEFHGIDLHRFVESRVGGYVAPGSPDRILRLLRAKGELSYELVDRRQSLYKATSIETQMELFR